MFQRWSTEHIAPRARAEFWRGAVCDAFLAMTPRLYGAPHTFDATLEHRALDAGVSLNTVTAPAHGVERTASDLSRGGKPCFFINVNLSGRSRLLQFGREMTSAQGELLVIDSSERYVLDQADANRLVSLAIPAAMMGRLTKDPHRWAASAIPQTAAAALLATQMRTLAQWQGEISPAEAGAIGDGLAGLVFAALGLPNKDARGGRFLVRRVRALIAENYADSRLTPQDLARACGCSLRSLHAAFAKEGGTIGAELMEQRLIRARILLQSPVSPVGIGAVAAGCGFVSAAHFSRSFRGRFGMSPSEFRRAL